MDLVSSNLELLDQFFSHLSLTSRKKAGYCIPRKCLQIVPLLKGLTFIIRGAIFFSIKYIYGLGEGCLCKLSSSESRTGATCSLVLWGITLASLEKLFHLTKIQSLAKSWSFKKHKLCKENHKNKETLMQLKVALSSRFEFARLFPLQGLPGPEIPASSEAAPRSCVSTVAEGKFLEACPSQIFAILT